MTELTADVARANRLPNDVARCPGVGSDAEGWREGCADCLRRLAPASGPLVSHMQPPDVIVFECEWRMGL